MRALDRRHRWDVVTRGNARTTHRCRVCGRTEIYEHLVPDVFMDAVLEYVRRPNPFSALRP